jgi:hypothetical protein
VLFHLARLSTLPGLADDRPGGNDAAARVMPLCVLKTDTYAVGQKIVNLT